ncbi:MAG: cell wall hydrolase [Methylovirgula sp.]
MPEEIQPRIVLKAHVHGFPETDRSHRGDPTVGLRPTFGSQLERAGGLTALRMHQMIFADAETFQSDAFVVGVTAPASDASSFMAWPEGENPTTAPAAARPRRRKPDRPRPTVRPISMKGSCRVRRPRLHAPYRSPRRRRRRLTPPLSKSSPYRRSRAGLRSIYRPCRPTGPDYAALIGEDQSQREEHCLAQAIYFEARSESEKGQAAVAQVVLNRVSSGLYPPTICGVVFQNRQYYHACQFSFACEGRSLRVTEPEAWRRAEHIAAAVTSGQTYVADVGDATHYHALYVHPYWARRLQRTDRIGQHVFYKLRPGQS